MKENFKTQTNRNKKQEHWQVTETEFQYQTLVHVHFEQISCSNAYRKAGETAFQANYARHRYTSQFLCLLLVCAN